MAFRRDPALFCGLSEDEMAAAAEGLDEFLADFQVDEGAVGATGICNPPPIADGDDEDMMGWNLLEICSKDLDPSSPPSSSAALRNTSSVQELLPSTSQSEGSVNLRREQGNRGSNPILPPPPPISTRPPKAVQGRAVRMGMANNDGAAGSSTFFRNAQRLPMTRTPTAPVEVEHRPPPYRSGLGSHNKNLMALPSYREWKSKQEAKGFANVAEGPRGTRSGKSWTPPE